MQVAAYVPLQKDFTRSFYTRGTRYKYLALDGWSRKPGFFSRSRDGNCPIQLSRDRYEWLDAELSEKTYTNIRVVIFFPYAKNGPPTVDRSG